MLFTDEEANLSLGKYMAISDQGPQIKPPAKPLFANGFEVQISNSDIMIVFSGGAERYEMHISMTLAKTLGIKLSEAMADIEAQMGQPIVTADRMNEIIESLVKKKNTLQ